LGDATKKKRQQKKDEAGEIAQDSFHRLEFGSTVGARMPCPYVATQDLVRTGDAVPLRRF